MQNCRSEEETSGSQGLEKGAWRRTEWVGHKNCNKRGACGLGMFCTSTVSMSSDVYHGFVRCCHRRLEGGGGDWVKGICALSAISCKGCMLQLTYNF